MSPHFTLRELTVTTRSDGADVDGDGDRTERFPNEPGPEHRARLAALCTHALEPIRAVLDVPLRITSGFRSPELNAAILGARSSQHMLGEAADFVPVGYPGGAAAAMARLVEEVRAGRLVVDQLIAYPSGFLHVSYTTRRANRGELLRSAAPRGSGGPYSTWTTAA